MKAHTCFYEKKTVWFVAFIYENSKKDTEMQVLSKSTYKKSLNLDPFFLENKLISAKVLSSSIQF